MDNKYCEKMEKCPLYAGILESNEVLVKTYKHLYCENRTEGHRKCRRYQVTEIAGSCPPDVLPNSHLSVNDVLKRMEKATK